MSPRWLVALALAAQCTKSSPATIDAGRAKPTPSADASAAAAPTAPPPHTDYTTIAQAEEDGAKSAGKTVLLTVTRGVLLPDSVKLQPCVYDVKDVRAVRASYASAQRAAVRSLPSTVAPGDCRRVIVKMTGRKPERGYSFVELVEVLDVRPAVEPPPKPPGVDYTSTDDLLLDGDAAAGKVAQLPVRKTSTPPAKTFGVQPCDVFGAGFEVEYQPAQQALVDALPTGFEACKTIKLKMKRPTNRRDGLWLAELIE